MLRTQTIFLQSPKGCVRFPSRQCQPFLQTTRDRYDKTPKSHIIPIALQVPVVREQRFRQMRQNTKILCLLGYLQTAAQRKKSHRRGNAGENRCLHLTLPLRRTREIRGSRPAIETHGEDIRSTALLRGVERQRATAHREELVEGDGCQTIGQAGLRTVLLLVLSARNPC